MSDPRHGERGSTAMSVVLLTPMMLVLLAFAVYAGRLSTIRQDVVSAAQDAARAASVRQNVGAASADATAAATSTLKDRGTSCASLSVNVATSGLAPGSPVTVEVSCTLDNGDISGFGMPGSRTVTSSSTFTIDRFRGGEG